MVNTVKGGKKRKAAVEEATANTVDANGSEKKAKDVGKEKGDADQQDKPDPIELKLAAFCKYYKEIELVPENEWRDFLKHLVEPPPVSFRIVESYRLCPSNIDTEPGVPSQAMALLDYIKKKHVETLNKLAVDKKPVKLELLPWYPKELGWSLNMAHENMDKYLGLKEFDSFLYSEKMQFTIQRLETWSMFPPILLDVQQHHMVLDMCAAPGFIASQVAELMHASPAQAHEGLLVLNDLFKLKDKMHWHWTRGTKVMYTNNDARTYPELYLSEEKTFLNRLTYDRIVCDVRCSTDGTMRKNIAVQDQWAVKAACSYHSEQKAILKRALELVKVNGRVLYCTTSMNPVENEAVIMAVLKETEGFVELLDCSQYIKDFKTRPGMTSWKIMLESGEFLEKESDATEEFMKQYSSTVFPPPSTEVMAYHMNRCVRVLPHDNDTAGFFCAVLVKKVELPSITVKLNEELAAAHKIVAPPPVVVPVVETQPEKKVYGYKIKLRCNISLSEIEWTTDTTNEDLATSTVVHKETFEKSPHELDPSCIPRELVPGLVLDDSFTFCTPEAEDWIKIKEFFKISDDFDPSCLLVREMRTEFYLTSPVVKSVILNNKDDNNVSIADALGVLMFQAMPKVWINTDPVLQVLMSHQGLAYLYPYIGKQIVNITKEDLLQLAFNERIKIDTLSEKAQADMKETEQGCVLFVYKPVDTNTPPICNISFVGIRGENYCTDFKDGRPSEKKNVYRLAGMELDDYKHQIQEEKLNKALERDRMEKATKMETS